MLQPDEQRSATWMSRVVMSRRGRCPSFQARKPTHPRPPQLADQCLPRPGDAIPRILSRGFVAGDNCLLDYNHRQIFMRPTGLECRREIRRGARSTELRSESAQDRKRQRGRGWAQTGSCRADICTVPLILGSSVAVQSNLEGAEGRSISSPSSPKVCGDRICTSRPMWRQI